MTVYLGLGSNLGDSNTIVQDTFEHISRIDQVWNVTCSPLYITSPISDIPQDDYVNAVCRFETSLDAHTLFSHLQEIERTLGKMPKPKNAPRIIDIDILFFGLEFHNTAELQIPHPRWKERLFVLIPLGDLVDSITYPISPGCYETLDLKNSFTELTGECNFLLEVKSKRER